MITTTYREHNYEYDAEITTRCWTFHLAGRPSGRGFLYKAAARVLYRAIDRPGAHERVEGVESLDLSVEQARDLFAAHPKIAHILDTLVAVGLGYIRLGQPATTLSGGEAQRIKLSRKLARRATGSTLYILNEPTTGLHFDDVKKLLAVLHTLADRGNTVVVIEHHLDVIKTADWVIDLGPEGGEAGGRIVAQGTPEQVATVPASFTGHYLASLLGVQRAKAR